MAMDVPVEVDCSFCAYLAGRRPYTVLERTDRAALLVTREQRGIGHLLAIPLGHRPTLLELEADEFAPLIGLVQSATAAIVQAYGVDGVAVWQNNGLSAHQTIPHLHFHIAGTRGGRPTSWGEVPKLPIEETDQIADRLRPHLAAS